MLEGNFAGSGWRIRFFLQVVRDRAPWLLSGLLLWGTGCGPMMAGGAAGTVAGIEYSYNSVARRTFTAEIDLVKKACIRALEEMAIEASGPIRTEEGFRIVATTPTLHIEIDLEPVSERVTRITVNAKAGMLKRDVATAVEIIRRTEHALSRETAQMSVREGG